MIQIGRPDDAVDVLRRALRVEPAYADAHWLLSACTADNRAMAGGWDEYEWRWHKMKTVAYHRGTPESPVGRRRYRRQDNSSVRGTGCRDAVQFVRYASLVKARGANVMVECHEEAGFFVPGVDGVSEAHARGTTLPPYDVACPLLSLPSVFRTTVGSIPGVVPYLVADPHRVTRWRRVLEPFRNRLCVGSCGQETPHM